MESRIEEVKSKTGTIRIRCHSHIKGLGLDKNLKSIEPNSFTSHIDASHGIEVDQIKPKKMAGKSLLFSKPPDKEVLALIMSKELGKVQ